MIDSIYEAMVLDKNYGEHFDNVHDNMNCMMKRKILQSLHRKYMHCVVLNDNLNNVNIGNVKFGENLSEFAEVADKIVFGLKFSVLFVVL